jgi:ubiquinone biosynthesis protein Coq4
VANKTLGFVALSSLKKAPAGPADPATALAELRRIYFKTTRNTIDHDFAHAISLLKTIASEEDRQKAAVFMEGINELRKEWSPKAPRPAAGSSRRPAPRKRR